jgi:antitoxin CcdA
MIHPSKGTMDLESQHQAGAAPSSSDQLAALWLQENKAALDSSNEYVEKHGLPLARYRRCEP